ncbi:tetratricopeptide repeat protein [Candidatus Litorirhabdus singularis]|nr:tetratricopeptide repeat protein [Candidatus Litorirhabdus singularis]
MAIQYGRFRTRLLLSTLVLLAGCAATFTPVPAVNSLDALQVSADRKVTPEQALANIELPALIELNDDMRDWVDRYVRSARNPRTRLELLHSSLRSGALHGLDYDVDADGSAQQAFVNGKANCLAYANLLVGMARYAGLDADYQLLTLRPDFSRFGTRVAVQQHVNVLVTLRDSSRYSVDLDPPPRDAVSASRALKDREAFALYHNNLAMNYLRSDDLEPAYGHALQALSLSPQSEFLWINLGVVYSRSGQISASAQSYHQALALNPDAGSAMNNLLVLHSRAGDTRQADYWEQAVADHQQRNPYYYVSLGEAAALNGELDEALVHYQEAIARKDSDPEFYFSIARLYLELQQPQLSIEYAEKAIEHAVLMQQRREYEAFLSQLTDATLAAL